MAALICSMQATGWQQHMCWWQPHTGQTLALYNTSHCTPVPPSLKSTRSGLIHDKNHAAVFSMHVAFFRSNILGEQKMQMPQGKPRWDLTALTSEVSGWTSADRPHPPNEPLPFVEPLFALSSPGSDLFALGDGESDKGMEGWREMEGRGGSSFV